MSGEQQRGQERSHWLWPLILSLLVYGMVVGNRWSQRLEWERQPDRYVVREIPLLTTLDAYYWTWGTRQHRLSEEEEKIPQRGYPDGIRLGRKLLIHRMLEGLTPLFEGSERWAGVALIPWLAGLFVLPLIWWSWREWSLAAGVMGALVGSFGTEYATRTAAGMVDTDALNLFFPFAAALVLSFLRRGSSVPAMLGWSLLGGLVLRGFLEWYDLAGFTLAYGAMLALILALRWLGWREAWEAARGRRARRPLLRRGAWALGGVALFFLAALPWGREGVFGLTWGVLRLYVGQVGSAAAQAGEGFELPSTLRTISEALGFQGWEDPLRRMVGSPWLGLAGLAGWLAWAVRRPLRALALLPLAAVGAMGLWSSRRFLIYLAPLVGLGLGYLVDLGWRGLRSWWRKRSLPLPGLFRPPLAAVLALAIFLIGLRPLSSFGFTPRPALSPAVYESLVEIREQVGEGAVVWTWWDYGYPLLDLGFKVFHDGGSQFTPKTYLVARSLATGSPAHLHAAMRFVAQEGIEGIQEVRERSRSVYEMTLEIGRYRQPFAKEPLYLLLTEDLIRKSGVLKRLGVWGFEPKGGEFDYPGYWTLDCEDFDIRSSRLECGIWELDLKTGEVNRGPGLRRAMVVEEGEIQQQAEWNRPEGFSLMVLTRKLRVRKVILAPEHVFQSNFNQFYVLGRYPEDLFEEVYSRPGAARLFRLKAGGAAPPALGEKQ